MPEPIGLPVGAPLRECGSSGSSSQTLGRTTGGHNGPTGQTGERGVLGRAELTPATPALPHSRDDRTPTQWVTELLAALGSTRTGKKFQCPAHGLNGDHSVSLSVRTADDGSARLHCFAGCGWRDILRALRLTPAALSVAPPTPPARHAAAFLHGVTFPPPKDGTTGSLRERGYRLEAFHEYGDPTPWAWKERHRHPSGAKEIRWESLNPHGERVPGLLGRREADMPLYHVRDIRMAVAADELVLLVESESSVDALVKAGWYATCWAGGAGSCPVEQLRADLGAARVVLIPDFDDAGLSCADRITKALPGARVFLGDPGEDARDMLQRVGPDRFRDLLNEVTS